MKSSIGAFIDIDRKIFLHKKVDQSVEKVFTLIMIAKVWCSKKERHSQCNKGALKRGVRMDQNKLTSQKIKLKHYI